MTAVTKVYIQWKTCNPSPYFMTGVTKVYIQWTTCIPSPYFMTGVTKVYIQWTTCNPSPSWAFQRCPQTSASWYWWSWLSAAGPLWSPRAFLQLWLLASRAVSLLPCAGGTLLGLQNMLWGLWTCLLWTVCVTWSVCVTSSVCVSRGQCVFYSVSLSYE